MHYSVANYSASINYPAFAMNESVYYKLFNNNKK